MISNLESGIQNTCELLGDFGTKVNYAFIMVVYKLDICFYKNGCGI